MPNRSTAEVESLIGLDSNLSWYAREPCLQQLHMQAPKIRQRQSIPNSKCHARSIISTFTASRHVTLDARIRKDETSSGLSQARLAHCRSSLHALLAALRLLHFERYPPKRKMLPRTLGNRRPFPACLRDASRASLHRIAHSCPEVSWLLHVELEGFRLTNYDSILRPAAHLTKSFCQLAAGTSSTRAAYGLCIRASVMYSA